MRIEPRHDAAALARVQAQFAAAKDQFAHSLALVPAGSARQVGEYREQDRVQPPLPMASKGVSLTVREVRAPEHAQAGQLTIEAVFANTGTSTAVAFAPLVVLLAADGREVSETYGPPQRLGAGRYHIPIRISG